MSEINKPNGSDMDMGLGERGGDGSNGSDCNSSTSDSCSYDIAWNPYF